MLMIVHSIPCLFFPFLAVSYGVPCCVCLGLPKLWHDVQRNRPRTSSSNVLPGLRNVAGKLGNQSQSFTQQVLTLVVKKLSAVGRRYIAPASTRKGFARPCSKHGRVHTKRCSGAPPFRCSWYICFLCIHRVSLMFFAIVVSCSARC